jgi:hypothetical protein
MLVKCLYLWPLYLEIDCLKIRHKLSCNEKNYEPLKFKFIAGYGGILKTGFCQLKKSSHFLSHFFTRMLKIKVQIHTKTCNKINTNTLMANTHVHTLFPCPSLSHIDTCYKKTMLSRINPNYYRRSFR